MEGKNSSSMSTIQEIKKCIDEIVDYESFKLSKRTMIKVNFAFLNVEVS